MFDDSEWDVEPLAAGALAHPLADRSTKGDWQSKGPSVATGQNVAFIWTWNQGESVISAGKRRRKWFGLAEMNPLSRIGVLFRVPAEIWAVTAKRAVAKS